MNTSPPQRADNSMSANPLEPERRTARVALLLGILAAGLFAWGGVDFCLDDAWIHLSYAKSLQLGDGPSYNPHDRELGFSSPLWMVILAGLPIQRAPIVSTKVMGAVLHGLTAYLSALVVIELAAAQAKLSRPVPLRTVGLLAGALIATQPDLLQGAVSGMEVPLAAALVTGSLLAVLRRAWAPAFLLGAAAALARPECVVPLAAFAALRTVIARDWRTWSAPLGSAAAIGLWSLYCQTVAGVPWPNTKYAKAGTFGLDGLSYLAEVVMPRQPWLVALTGAIVIAVWIIQQVRARRFDASLVLFVSWVATLVAIAVSRPLQPATDFYEWRYFAPFAGLPYLALSVALLQLRPRTAGWVLVPIILVTGLTLARTHTRTRAQERNVLHLHTQPARWIAAKLPATSTVAVEGAGALRFHTPRAMQIIDLLGLNDGAIVHAASDRARVCLIAARAPAYFVIPDNILQPLAPVFDLRPLESFFEPDYRQVTPTQALRVHVLASRGLRPRWSTRCADVGEVNSP